MAQILSIRAGQNARRILHQRGLRPEDVTTLVAAAGGPKGLALMALDRFLFDDWLKRAKPARPRLLIGASIGAWRFAAASRLDAAAALNRLAEAYVEQRYAGSPSELDVSRECRRIVSAIDRTETGVNEHDPNYHLAVITARSRGVLTSRYSRARFGLAALGNLLARERLAHFFERVVFLQGDLGIACFDAFGITEVALTPGNRIDALLASGSIPLVARPVSTPAGAPAGLYWDGGLIDYHIDWPWQQRDGLVLYPHFVDHIVPGWLDKALPWRRAGGAATDNLIVISPSEAFLASLPGRKLPDRNDFYQFGLDHDGRIARWRAIMQKSEAMCEAFDSFASNPSGFSVKPF
jgi:predicted acylesterase/phospholipase RssA